MTHIITDRQLEIIYGSLLGDASLEKPRTANTNSRWRKAQCFAHTEYIEWHTNELSSLISRSKADKTMVRIDTKSNSLFTELRRIWYPNGKKIVPTSIKLTPLMVAVWYADDGWNSPQKRCANFATNGFSLDDCQLLISQLKLLNIDCYISKKKTGPIITTFANSYEKFISLIKPYFPWECFNYKIDLSKFTPRKYGVLTEDNIKEIFQLSQNDISSCKISNKFGVNSSYIRRILRGERRQICKK